MQHFMVCTERLGIKKEEPGSSSFFVFVYPNYWINTFLAEAVPFSD